MIHTWSNKIFKGTDVNRPLPTLHWESLEITLTVPLTRNKFRETLNYLSKEVWESVGWVCPPDQISPQWRGFQLSGAYILNIKDLKGQTTNFHPCTVSQNIQALVQLSIKIFTITSLKLKLETITMHWYFKVAPVLKIDA